MDIIHENLYVRFHFEDNPYDDSGLEDYLRLEVSDTEDLLNFLKDTEIHIYDKNMPFDEETILKFIIEHETTNTDLGILFMSWALDQDSDIFIYMYGDSPFWVLHDIHHAMKDVDGYMVVSNAGCEESAHDFAKVQCEERGFRLPDKQVITAMQEAFTRRFNTESETLNQILFDYEEQEYL